MKDKCCRDLTQASCVKGTPGRGVLVGDSGAPLRENSMGRLGSQRQGRLPGALSGKWAIRKIEIAIKTGSDHETHGTLLNALA